MFRDPPRQRNRVWQMDFSEFETARGGIWRICAVIDYASKYCLATTVTPTSRGQDVLACLRRAVVEAERVLDLDDLRADRGWMNVVNADNFVIGEAPAPIAVVTAGSCAAVVDASRGHRSSRGVGSDGTHPQRLVPLAAWFRRRGAEVVLLPPERSADLRRYYAKHTKSDRLVSQLLARLPMLHPTACMPNRASGPVMR